MLNQELIEEFAEAVYEMAITEGFNVKSKDPIDGQELGLWLESEIGGTSRPRASHGR
ncbi:hypothetical protein ISS39_04755 [Candidatus Bathyarchaeota archaeon]|nr:hypothetical protein [Candidatus Bathyarchaeota archaeon]